jgi:aspartate carbamoyltransferase catalytic subunit
MELDNLIPSNSESWNIKNGTLFYRKLHNIPMAQIENNIVYIFMECSLPRVVISLIKHVMTLDIEFYLLPPSWSHPANIVDNSYAIRHYFSSYAMEEFFIGLKKIDFDIVQNLTRWCQKEKCIELIKPNYDIINTKVQKMYYDYYSNKEIGDFPIEVREEFRTLYRDIQISMIL